MRHATAADRGRGRLGYRNYFCAEVGGEDERLWWLLVGLGLAEGMNTINGGTSRYFCVSPKGLKLIGVKLREP
jgi:hypothetical protein